MTRAELAEYTWLVSERRRAEDGEALEEAAAGVRIDVDALIGTGSLERAIAQRRPGVEAYIASKPRIWERKVLTLRVLCGLPWKNVAIGCGVSEGAVRQRYYRAVADLD